MQVFFCTVAVLAAFIYTIIWDFMYCSSQAKQLDALLQQQWNNVASHIQMAKPSPEPMLLL